MHAPKPGTPRSALLSKLITLIPGAGTSRPRIRVALSSKLITLLLLALFGAILAGCPSSDRSDGVELVMSSGAPSSAMTFELRFDAPMVDADQIGSPAASSPLVINPSLHGAFTWLSPRSGVFTPSEPLALDTTYELTLAAGLARADGRKSAASLYRVLATPEFSVAGFSPREPDKNATSEPEMKLAFNSEISAADAQGLLYFRDDAGHHIPADVRQGTMAEDYDLNYLGSSRPWRYDFDSAHRTNATADAESEYSATNAQPNLLVATPHENLPKGKSWRLVAPAGIRAAQRGLHLRKPFEVSIGDVTPFTVESVLAENYIYSGPSIQLLFSKPVPPALTNGPEGWLDLQPCPTNLAIQLSWRGVVLRGAFEAPKTYALKLLPGFQAAEPFALTGSNTFTLEIPHVAPRLYFPAFSRDQLASGRRTIPLLSVNVPGVRVRAKLLDPQNAIHALRGYSDYFVRWNERRDNDAPFENYHPISYNLIPGRTVFDEVLAANGDADAARKLDLSWDELLPGRKTGVVFLDASRTNDNPRLGAQALIQLTDLGLVWKHSPAGVEVLAFSHETGRPLPGVTARLFSDENEPLGDAITGENGIARLAAKTNAAWVAVQKDDDFHALPLNEHPVSLYRFGIAYHDKDEEDGRRVLMFGDRRLYRPGESMHLYALARNWDEQGLGIPAGAAATLECLDSRERVFFRTNATFSAFGSWSETIPLPATTRGGCTARLSFSTNECYYLPFSIHDFQPSAFEVSVRAPDSFAADEPVALPVSARYYFGKTLSRAQVKWSLEGSDAAFHPDRFSSFQFHATSLENHGRDSGSSISLHGDGSLNGTNNLLIAPDITINPASPQPRHASLLVEVTDINQQTISHRHEFIHHSSDFYLGLRANSEVIQAGQKLPLEILAVAADEKPWPSAVKARLTLQRVDWESVRIQGAGKSVRYRNEAVLTNLLERDFEVAPVSLPAQAEAEVTGNPISDLPTLDAGQYLVSASATDPAGRPVASSLMFYVSAPGRSGHDYQNDVQLTLKPSQKLYQPGNTAEILVEAPFSGTALVTVERDKVLRSFTTRLEGNTPLIQIPLTTNDVPNVFVSVTLLRGSADSPHQAKEPESRIGYCELSVGDPADKLAVAVTPAVTNCRPAQTVEVAVQVANHAGAPVAGAEVVLYAVDEGVVSLSDGGLPDPLAFFYASRPLAVQTGVSLRNLLEEDPTELYFANKGYLVGGGGTEAVRRKFLACAFWQADLKTGADGRVLARFPAPDSLTRYRLCAVANAGKKQFGSAQSEFRVTKPLILEPALPAFANLTDRLAARGVLLNQTTSSQRVVVTLQLDDKVKTPPAERLLTQTLEVPAGGSTAAEFPVEFASVGTATWIWKARFADPGADNFTDAVESKLEVGHVVPMLREVLLGHVTGRETNLLAGADPQLLAGQGSVTVTVANTRLNDLAEAASQLLHYPYGCAEQTGSSLLPWIVLSDAPGLLPQLRRGTNEMNAAIRAGVARLLSMQTSSGGLGYWPRASEPMLWASAYGGMVLTLARRHGVEVPNQDFEALLKYLGKELSSTNGAVNPSDACLALYTLALAGKPEPAYHENLFEQREQLSPENQALLALAIAESDGPTNMIIPLLQAAAKRSRAADNVFGCPARERAIRLLAWLRCRTDDRILDRLVDDLMRDQKNANWGTTQGNAWGLLALTDYARQVEATRPPSEGTLEWNGRRIAFQLDAATNVATFTFPSTNRSELPLLLSKTSTNRLYTSVLIEARPPEVALPRQNRGFGLQRRYEVLDDENLPHEPKSLRVGDRVLVTLNISVNEPASYVALDDALPAILEPVNPEFSTREARYTTVAENGGWLWGSDFREFRKDRCLYFADSLPAGNYTLRYLARVRAAGSVTAPTAKIEEMYHPERYGLSGTQTISSGGLQ